MKAIIHQIGQALSQLRRHRLSGSELPERVEGAFITPSAFGVVNERALIGRTLPCSMARWSTRSPWKNCGHTKISVSA
jgi:hypothetical protein